MAWSWQDIVGIAVLLFFIIRGIKVGAGKPFSESLVVVLSLVVAGLILSLLFKPLVKETKEIEGIIFVLGLVASLFAFRLPGKAVAKFVNSLRLGTLNPLLGFIFGTLEGFLVVGSVVIIISFFPGLSHIITFRTVDAFRSVAGFFAGM